MVNTAEVYSDDELQDSSTATTVIDCYLPEIDKTASGNYDERHEWDVKKTVDPNWQSGYPSDELIWTWTIDVFEDIFEENFDVSGTITVDNPNPEDALVVSLEDWVNARWPPSTKPAAASTAPTSQLLRTDRKPVTTALAS